MEKLLVRWDGHSVLLKKSVPYLFSIFELGFSVLPLPLWVVRTNKTWGINLFSVYPSLPQRHKKLSERARWEARMVDLQTKYLLFLNAKMRW